MTIELYYNTELGAVIDRNKYTRCIGICIEIRGFPYRNISQYAFWRIFAPLTFTIFYFQLQEKITVSVDNLQRCMQCGRMIRMPNFHSITVPGEYQDNPEFHWDNGVEIPAEEYICQVCCSSNTKIVSVEKFILLFLLSILWVLD